jgi:hypothetical protein
MEAVANVYLEEGLFGERPVVRAELADRSRGFTDLARAVRWAERRAERVRVLVGGLSAWEPWPEGAEDRERLEAYVRRRFERFDREYRERRSEPAAWFYAVRDPDVADVADLGLALAAQPEVVGVSERGGWWVIRLRARTIHEAITFGNDVFLRIAWPPERRYGGAEEGCGDRGYVVSHGGDVAYGLAEYEEETLAEARTSRS